MLAISVSLDGRFLASAGEDFVIRVWNLSTAEKRFELLAPAEPAAMCFDKDVWRLWVLCDGGLLAVFDIGIESRRQCGPLSCFPLRAVLGGSYYALQTQSGGVCLCADGDGGITVLRLHSTSIPFSPEPDPLPSVEAGVIQIAGTVSADGMTQVADESTKTGFPWVEFSGPLGVILRRVGGCSGRVSAHVTTAGTNDDDPDYTPTVEVVEWVNGDVADKTVWIAMRSFNAVEWDSLAHIWCDAYPDYNLGRAEIDGDAFADAESKVACDSKSERIRVEARLAAFSRIARIEGRVAHCKRWHPPLVASAPDLSRAEAEARDAERAFLTGVDGSAERREQALGMLERLRVLGSDADVGLCCWSLVRGAVAVVQASDDIDLAMFSDPLALEEAFAAFCLETARRAERAGAVALLVVGPGDIAMAAKWPDVDRFDERTGLWAAPGSGVGITVAVIGRTAGSPSMLREGSILALCPDAPNDAFRRRTGIVPRMQLDMAGDETFEVLLDEPCGGASLDPGCSKVTVRIVSAVEAQVGRARNIAGAVEGNVGKEAQVNANLINQYLSNRFQNRLVTNSCTGVSSGRNTCTSAAPKNGGNCAQAALIVFRFANDERRWLDYCRPFLTFRC